MISKLFALRKDEDFGEIFSGSIYALSSRILAVIFSLVANIIIARRYGAGIMGLVALLSSYLSIITIFTVFGSNVSILRFIPEQIEKFSYNSAFLVYRKILYIIIGISILGTILFWFGSDFVAGTIFSKPQYSLFFALASLFIIPRALQEFFQSVSRGLKLLRGFAILQFTPQFFNVSLLILLTLLFSHKYIPVMTLLTSFFLTSLVGMTMIERVFRKNLLMLNKDTKSLPLKEIFYITLPMFMTTSTLFLISNVDILIIGAFRSEEEIGYYFIASRLAFLTSFVLSSINSIAAPKFSELYHAGNFEGLTEVARKSTKLIFWTTAPVIICLAIFGFFILKIFFGESFTASYGVLIVLSIGQMVNSITGSIGYLLNMTGHEKVDMIINLLVSILNILGNLMVVKPFGMFGVGLVTMFSISLKNIIASAWYFKKYRITIFYLPFLKL